MCLFHALALGCLLPWGILAQEADWQYGTEMRFLDRSDLGGAEPLFLTDLAELDGLYEGAGSRPGDRRFDCYDRVYRIEIRVREPQASVSPVQVDWLGKTQKWDGADGSTADLVKFSVREAQTSGSQILGTMHASLRGKIRDLNTLSGPCRPRRTGPGELSCWADMRVRCS
jgi:hypothetical protein